MFEYDFESILDESQMLAICNSWISDKPKMESLAGSDNRPLGKIIQDAVLGMVGEQGSYNWVSKYYECEQPFFGVLKRDAGIWSKDLITQEDVRIRTAAGNVQIVERSISCKSQFHTATYRLKDKDGLPHEEPSWTFQDKTDDRFADPMLSDPNCNKLLIVCWVDDRLDGGNVYYQNPKAAYEKGFRWRPRMCCFWWPEVFKHLGEMARKDLRDKKRALYYKDIKHLRAELLS